VLIEKPANHVGEVLLAAMVGDDDISPATSRTEDDEEAPRAATAVLVVKAGGSARQRRDGCEHIIEKLIGALIKAGDGAQGIVRLSVEIKDVLHPPPEVRLYPTQTPLPSLPRLEAVFF
jgi:hypothetical protein